jgi:hypothetical protein
MLLVALFASAASCAPGASGVAGASAAKADEVVIVSANGEHRFKVEVADDDEERRIGLMYRTSLAENAGMIFDFRPENEIQSMWMKNTLIPLDMAFIAADGRIVTIAAETTPRSLQSVRSDAPAVAVLEVNGGRLEALGVKVGDLVRHPIFDGAK